MRLKGKKLKDEKMKDLHSHGGQVKSQWNSLRLRRGKIKKKKECNSLAKMFVFFFFHVADTVHRILQKPKQTLAKPIVTKTT